MTQRQKEHTGDNGHTNQKPVADPALAEKASKAKDILAKLEKAAKKKGGHYVRCCDVSVWVPD